MTQHFQPQQGQSMSSILSQVATIVYVENKALGTSRQDKGAAALSERAHNAKGGIAKVNVSRLAGAEDRLKEIRATVTEAREVVFNHTTSWGERRLLANVNIEKMLRSWQPVKNRYDELVQKLSDDAPALVEQARMNLGTFDVDVPEVEEIRGAFSLEFRMEPVPDASKFNASNLDKQIEAELRRRFEADVAAAYQKAQQDAMQRLQEPLAKLVDRMEAYEKREADKAAGRDPGKEGYFRDTLVDNLHQIAGVFDSFNLLGDPSMKRISEKLRAFDNLDAKALRGDEATRHGAVKNAQEILAELDGLWIK